jgi:phosphatidylglycerol:prolipoprotein diacylglycerol transferase
MIVVSIDPIAFSLGTIQVRWFGILAVLAVLVTVGLTVRGARKAGVAQTAVLDAAALAIPVGVVCARALHVLGGWDYYVTQPGEIWQLNLGGLSLWGALIGGGIALAWALRSNGLVRAGVADLAAPAFGLGIAIGSIGSFIDGDGLGVPSSLPWAAQYTYEAAMVPDFGVPRHPVQLYLGLGALLLAALVLVMPRSAPAGWRAWLFLLGFGILRIAVSPLRLDPPFVLDLQVDQLLAILVAGWAALQMALAVLHVGARRPAVAGPG